MVCSLNPINQSKDVEYQLFFSLTSFPQSFIQKESIEQAKQRKKKDDKIQYKQAQSLNINKLAINGQHLLYFMMTFMKSNIPLINNFQTKLSYIYIYIKNKAMNLKTLLMSVLVLSMVAAQTTTCTQNSTIDKLITGVMDLNLNDVDTSSATKDFYLDISSANFPAVDVLGSAFALTTFESSCSETIYSLGMEIVEPQNGNTRMRLVVGFRDHVNSTSVYITKWSRVSFSYLIVSRTLDTTVADIWASSSQTVGDINNGTAGPIDTIATGYQNGISDANCRVFSDPDIIYAVPSGCDGTNAIGPGGLGGGSHILHSYVMGFIYEPALDTANDSHLSAGGLNSIFDTPADNDIGGAGWTVIDHGTNPAGPRVIINDKNNALKWLKLAFVWSRFDKALTDSAPPTYPHNSNAIYSSAYIYQKVEFSEYNSIQQVKNDDPTNYNTLFYPLLDLKYTIFGLSYFDFPKSTSISCSRIFIQAELVSINSFRINTNLQATPSATNSPKVVFSADIFSKNVDTICKPQPEQNFAVKPYTTSHTFFTVPTLSSEQYVEQCLRTDVNCAPDTAIHLSTDVLEANDNGYTGTLEQILFFTAVARATNTTDTVSFQFVVPFEQLTFPQTGVFDFGYYQKDDIAGPIKLSLSTGNKATISVKADGALLYSSIYTGVGSVSGDLQLTAGHTITAATSTVTVDISFARSSTEDQTLFFWLALTTFTSSYDPATGCCVSSCPTGTGVSTHLAYLPVCVQCDTVLGLVYSSTNSSCVCLTGFYQTNVTTQCFPCSALYCATCDPDNPAVCNLCVTGATLSNVTQTCTCGTGYFINGTSCVKCPYNCQTCSDTTGLCLTCVDSQRRDITQGCACINGFFDSGAINCTACPGICLTCNSSTTCTSCNSTHNRNLTGTVCNCVSGYYELYHDNLTKTCEKCNPQCLTCAISPTSCTSCDASKNRVLGTDSYGHATCLCLAGFYSTPDGSCIQADCNADPFCSQCQQGLKLCIQCLSSKNRVINRQTSRCDCMKGYYPGVNDTCTPCGSGCGNCASATQCLSCVPLATSTFNGNCSCPSQTFFTISPLGVRYCENCPSFCTVCSGANTCTTCLDGYTKTADNQCICPSGSFVDANKNCLACASGCTTCSSTTACTSCIQPLVLQGTNCQTNCNNGFTALGGVCKGCPTSCLQCTQNLYCFYCADNTFLYNGKCFSSCPAGTIGDRTSSNWQCVPCNSPCKTCINHPSYCTSCEAGKGYLQSSAVQQSCVLTCDDGTYARDGVCQVCDFKCGTCLGSASTCTSCPSGQLLFQSTCWANCPAILVNGNCQDKCPDGFYKFGPSECAPCAPQCVTCQGSSTNCSSCLQGSVSLNGTCITQCPENQFSFLGICLACSESCYGCKFNPTNCLTCAQGYVRSGSLCQRGCLSFQYYDNSAKRCVQCDESCASCTTRNFCKTCKDSNIKAIGGVCSECSYPCRTCQSSGICKSCLSGFYLFNGLCQPSCPLGSSPFNGVCRCNSGIISNGVCVTSCDAGFTTVGGSCVPCNSNCAECSGTINTCTKCISGFALDVNSKKCISLTVCPYGQDLVNNKCERICDQGFLYYENFCIFGGCYDNYVDNNQGGCTRSASVSSIVRRCNAGQFELNGNCVSSCGLGYFPDSNSVCQNCPANCEACFSSSFCGSCSSGFTNSNGRCQQQSTCLGSQIEYDGDCLNSCPQGTHTSGENCVRNCPVGTYYDNRICFSTCISKLRTKDACVTRCPLSTTDNNGVCE